MGGAAKPAFSTRGSCQLCTPPTSAVAATEPWSTARLLLQIAAKVEIHVGLLPEGGGADLGAVPWKRLGHLSFDTNERSQLSARELKSVMLAGVPAQLVRFQFVRCHGNKLNVYNQVGRLLAGWLSCWLASLRVRKSAGAGTAGGCRSGKRPAIKSAEILSTRQVA